MGTGWNMGPAPGQQPPSPSATAEGGKTARSIAGRYPKEARRAGAGDWGGRGQGRGGRAETRWSREGGERRE